MKLLRDYGLSITLFFMFLVSWVAQYYFQWNEYVLEQMSHGQSAELGQFIYYFGSATFENWQSEFLQLFTMVVLTSLLIHKGSTESKDGQDRLEKKIDAIATQIGLDVEGVEQTEANEVK